jgi:hypothetical protein
MLDLIHLNKRNMPLSILPNVLLKQQMSLLYRYNLIGQRMHHQESTPHIGNMIYVGKVILLELNVMTIVLMEHARKRTNRALKNGCLNAISSRVYYHWKSAETKTPKNDLIKRLLQPSQDQLQVFAYDILSYIRPP